MGGGGGLFYFKIFLENKEEAKRHEGKPSCFK
jgi:hypothetical protein